MTGVFVEELDSLVNQGAVPADRLSRIRRQAMERFTALGFPTTHDEDWKFTSVAAIANSSFRAPSPDALAAGPADVKHFGFAGSAWCELVFVNGYLAPHLSSFPPVTEEATVMGLAEALRTQPALVERNLGRFAGFEDKAFTALNTALMSDGAFIHVPSGRKIERPIHLLFLSAPGEIPTASYPRNLILVDESAEVSVVESYSSPTNAVYFTNAVTEIAVGPNARVEHIKLQRESESAYHVGTIEARQERDSRFRSFSFAIGGALARTNVYSVMGGPGSDCSMNGLYMLHGTQHLDQQTRIEHAQPNCTSREVYKGVLDGSSHGVFNGKVFVRPEAQKTDGKQTNKNLLLSDGAKVDTKPQLEIFADDVKCTHGATVGRLDDIALFYLRSRGLSGALARRLLTYAFAAEVLAEIEQIPIRDRLDQLVFQRLETLEASAWK